MNPLLVPSAILLLLIGFIWGLLASYQIAKWAIRYSAENRRRFWAEFVEIIPDHQFQFLLNECVKRLNGTTEKSQ